MLSLLEIPAFIAQPLFVMIPVLMIVLSYVIIKFADSNSASKIKRFMVHLVRPIELQPIESEDTQEADDKKNHLKRQIGLRLGAIYLAIGVFLLCSLIGTFYYIMADLTHEIGNWNTDAIRTWTTVVIATPFSGGWLGSFPWYGSAGSPPSGIDIFHDPWDWLYFVAAFTDNPDFVSGIFPDVLIIPVLCGLVFLLPLIRKTFREAFVPSLFLFTTAMLTMTSGIFRGFAQALSIEIGSGSIQFGIMIASRSNFDGLTLVMIQILTPVILLMFLMFLPMSWKLAKIHYPEKKLSRRLFLLFLVSSYWLSLLTMFLSVS